VKTGMNTGVRTVCIGCKDFRSWVYAARIYGRPIELAFQGVGIARFDIEKYAGRF